MDKTTPHPLFKLATELGPLVIFFIANFKFHLFVATGAFMVAIIVAMIATVAGLEIVVSWNHRCLANERKWTLFNAVNRLAGYEQSLMILTPFEVMT